MNPEQPPVAQITPTGVYIGDKFISGRWVNTPLLIDSPETPQDNGLTTLTLELVVSGVEFTGGIFEINRRTKK